MFLNRRMNEKFQKKVAREQLREAAMAGTGVYLFQNNSKADLFLPKPANNGSRSVGPSATFEGDSYFFSLVRTNQIKLIKEIEITPPEEETPMIEQKLILDQPDRVTGEGTVENVVARPKQIKKVKNESRQPRQPEPDILLNEDPMAGVEILKD